jgi:hypothetical protein
MHKNNQIQILIIVSALSTLIITNAVQYQQQDLLAFGQTPPEESVAGEQTFRSAFDTFVSSEPGGYGITYRITDENSAKSFDIIKDVTVQE